MLIIPAIDIYEGKCVRLRQGMYDKHTVYTDSPSEVAHKFVEAGFLFLHVVDLEGAKEKKIKNWKTIEALAKVPGAILEVGGGVRTSEDIQLLFSLGVHRVIIGSIAAAAPQLAEEWIKEFGAQRIVIGMDVKNGSVAVSGWIEDSGLKPEDFIQQAMKYGATTFICTDISKDGMLEGVNREFYSKLVSKFPSVKIIASGGVTSMKDLEMLKEIDVEGVVIGKALYEGRIDLKDLIKFKANLC